MKWFCDGTLLAPIFWKENDVHSLRKGVITKDLALSGDGVGVSNSCWNLPRRKG
jgi:hypothetical protein